MDTNTKPLVIFSAGGKGTRIQSLNSTVPKPMIPIAGKPILQWGIENLVSQGYTRFIITVSHMADKIESYFGDGSKFNAHITYYTEDQPLGNAGALFKLWESRKLEGSFLYFIADAIFSIDADRFYSFHCSHNALASLFCHPNGHPYDSSILVTSSSNTSNSWNDISYGSSNLDSDGTVVQWLNKEDERPEFYKNCVNAGLQILSTELLELSGIKPETVGAGEGQRKVDLDRDVLKPAISTGRIKAYHSSEYCKDAGTPERFHSVEEDIRLGRVEAKNLHNPQKAIFLDRDGTINRYVGFLRDPEQLELVEGAAEAIKLINSSDYLAIVITNQPVIARGEVTVEELNLIHAKLETLLGTDGAFLDALYYCPHHPDSGYEGEVVELKIPCECRKPKPGLILRACKDFNIDASQSIVIGDSPRDIECGKNAGCKTVLLTGSGTEVSSTPSSKHDIEAADYEASDLLSAVKMILGLA